MDMEARMLAREAGYVEALRGRVVDLNAAALEAMQLMYRTGWRDAVREVTRRDGWHVVLDTMRGAGWAVVVSSPEELVGIDERRFAERLDDLGEDLRQEMQPEQDWIEP
jgi:hypothetical protein